MDIKKVRLLKVKDGHGLDLTIDAQDKAGAAMNGNDKYKGLVHQDLRNAIDGLKIHYAMVAGFVPTDAVEDIAQPDMALFEKYHVHGYSIGGDDDKPGITISGHVINYRGKAVNYHTPFELFDCAPESRYMYMDDLQARLRVCEQEVEKYLGGKRGEPHKPQEEKEPVDERQGDLFKQNGSEVVNKIQIAEPINPGGAGMKLAEADPEAQARVAADDETPETGKGNKNTNRRRARQTPDNKDGTATT
jgi:hypothetical protein